jgi:acyl-ACP thioesterase
VWVNVDPETQTPARLPRRFLEAYGLAGERRPRSRLRHPPPPDSAPESSWTFRAGDLDVVGHVNNARYWAIADEFLVDGDGPVEIEVEHRNAAPSGEATVRVANGALWVTSPAGEVYASAEVL